MASGAKKSRKLLATSSSPNHSNNNSGDEVESGGTSNREGSEEFEPGSWECTVCTFRNKYEAFKCLMCDTRKGTSTRKPRLNPSVVQQQTLVQKLAAVEQKKQRHSSEARNSPDLFVSPLNIGGNNSSAPITPSNNGHRQQENQQSKSHIKTSFFRADFLVAGPSTSTSTAKLSKRRPIIPFRDALVVRSSAKRMVVTVEGRNFTITEFKPRTSPRGRKKLSANTSINSPLSAAKTSSASTPLKTTKEQ